MLMDERLKLACDADAAATNPAAKLIRECSAIGIGSRYHPAPFITLRDPDCQAHDKPREFYLPLDDPDGEGHCWSCHCRCPADSPLCGHWIGCPGC